jgi:hypothetical protein
MLPERDSTSFLQASKNMNEITSQVLSYTDLVLGIRDRSL